MKCDIQSQLLGEIEQRLRNSIPNYVPIVGCDDPEELLQDGVVIAINMHRRARKAGKKVTSSNLTHYALLHLRAGRRSTGYKKNDAMHPAAQINGHSRLQSMDATTYEDEYGQEYTLHDCLAAPVEDPATIAARRLDWDTVLNAADRTAKAILVALVEGTELTLLVRKLGRSRSFLQSHKDRLGRLVREKLGDEILRQVESKPLWADTVDAVRERLTCQAERRAA